MGLCMVRGRRIGLGIWREAAVLPQKHDMQTGQHMHASQQLRSSMWGAVCKLTGEAWREGELQNGKQTAERKSSRALNGSSLSMGHVKCRVKCYVKCVSVVRTKPACMGGLAAPMGATRHTANSKASAAEYSRIGTRLGEGKRVVLH